MDLELATIRRDAWWLDADTVKVDLVEDRKGTFP